VYNVITKADWEIASQIYERAKRRNPLIAKAEAFAIKAHEGQVRKYTGVPYHGHPIAVAKLALLFGATDAMVIASLLHDTVEDTSVTFDDLRAEGFPERSVELVHELTEVDDDEHWAKTNKGKRPNRATRRALEVARREQITAAGQTLTCCDAMANGHDIRPTCPDKKFAKMYLTELVARITAMTKADGHARDCALRMLTSELELLEKETA
jgi:(p)ppGpp synthase/HD superfamily hydrolase